MPTMAGGGDFAAGVGGGGGGWGQRTNGQPAAACHCEARGPPGTEKLATF